MNELLSFYIRDIIQETSDTRTFILENTEHEKITYQAGQFLTFVFEVNGHEVNRSFSMSSAPETDDFISITVKRVPNGEITRLLFDHFQTGDILYALPPAGRFTLSTHITLQRDIFLIGAGSGITPLYALLKKILHTEPKSRVILLYSNHNEKSAIFFRELNELAEQFPEHFLLIHLFSEPSASYQHLQRRLTKDFLQKTIQQHQLYNREEALFYLCGPSDFMRNATIAIVALEYGKVQIHSEEYIIKPVTTHIVDTRPKQVTIFFRNQTYNLTLTSESILQAALEAGIRLPYSCRGGRCSACAAICRKGKVQMLVNEVLTDRDVEEGYILTCTGHPETEETEIYI
jgi:ring-1,2-phenylacetyl-CoA epoxidase subunit PaaE